MPGLGYLTPNDGLPSGCANHYIELHPIWWSIQEILGGSVAANCRSDIGTTERQLCAVQQT